MEPIQKQGNPSPRINNSNLSKSSLNRPDLNKSLVKENLSDKMDRVIDKLEYDRKKDETKKKQGPWKFPMKWRRVMNKSLKPVAKDMILFFYLNIKNELESPRLLPIYSGNMVIYKNTPYEVDPRAVWTTRIGKRVYKLLIYKQIDRRPVSNLNYTEIKRRGDATDSDEFLIKAALRAQQSKLTKQQVSRGVVIITILAVLGGVVWFMSK